MKRIFTMIFSAAALAFGGCAYDDGDLWNKVNEIDNRLTEVEKWNKDVASISAIVAALENGRLIAGVTETAEGYVIEFDNGDRITVRHGAAGEAGKDAPMIGVDVHSDGFYYWTITVGGEQSWLTDKNGNMLKVTGSDGAAGPAPVIGVSEDGYWTVNGVKIESSPGVYVKASGADGKDGDSFFKSVAEDGDTVTITLSDGSVIAVPKKTSLSFVINGGSAETVLFIYGATKELPVQAAGVVDYTIGKPDGWKATYSGGVLSVTAPAENNVYADFEGEIAVVAVSASGASAISKINVKASDADYELRVLTFEDGDYKGGAANYWTSLVDSPQYGGPLLYGDMMSELDYAWYDEGNTYLGHELPFVWGTRIYFGGGHAVSNYVEAEIAKGNYATQLSVYCKDQATGYGGHNGSKNFCVHYGYAETQGLGNHDEEGLPYIYFTDYKARVVDHMYVTMTTYLINCVYNGNALTEPVGEDDYVRLVAIGFDENFEEVATRLYFDLATDGGIVADWQKWDLSPLGKVTMIYFNVTGSNDNGYGFSQPAYFAYDDVAVRFE